MSRESNLPVFEIQKNLSENLRTIEIAKAMSLGWYKGQFDYYLRKAGKVTFINGEEYYTNVPIGGNLDSYKTKGTQGYYIGKFLGLIGLQDEDIDQLASTFHQGRVDGLYHRWIAKEKITKQRFKQYISKLQDEISDVDTIEIDYELMRYKTSVYPLEASRIYQTRESIYGGRLQWGQKQLDFKTLRWEPDGRIFKWNNILYRTPEIIFGNAIRFKKGLVDVTGDYTEGLVYAIQSMIAYSGIDFMDRISYSKTGERPHLVEKYDLRGGGSLPTEHYTSVIGTEIYSAHIKSAFELDEEEVHYNRYTGIDLKREALYINENTLNNYDYMQYGDDLATRVALRKTSIHANETVFHYTTAFWNWTKFSEGGVDTVLKMIDAGDEFLFYDTKDRNLGAWIKVKEFRKLSMEDMSYYIGNYFDIWTTSKSGSFFSGFFGGLAKILGIIFDIAFEIIKVVPAMYLSLQVLTIAVNKIFGSDLTEKEVFALSAQIAVVVISVLLAPASGGTSLGLTSGQFMLASGGVSLTLSLGIAGSEANEKKKFSEEMQKIREAEQEQIRLARENEKKDKDISSSEEHGDGEKEDFEAFLVDPLFELKREKNKMDSDLKSQFKLL